MTAKKLPLYLANEPVFTAQSLTVYDKFSGQAFAEVASADEATIKKAIQCGVAAEASLRALTSFQRREILSGALVGFEKRRTEFEKVLVAEGGKPLRDAKVEVDRFIDTFRIAAEEASRVAGEYLPLDTTARGKGYQGIWKRVPIGLCSFISPFNFPLNLAAHKIAPAIASGCPFVLKPATLTPVSALMIADVLSQVGLPKGAFSVLPVPREHADLMATDGHFKLLSFTGSPQVGWELKAKAGKKKVVLELGGNAACIVDETADWQAAIPRLLAGSFSHAGQSCISVQRILVHETIYSAFRDTLVKEAKKLVVGDPAKEDTFAGPMISEKEAARLEGWVKESLKQGASLLCGGQRQGNRFDISLLENVPAQESLSCEEAFGPVAILEKFSQFDEALEKVNASRFGLQAGVFTNDLKRALRAWDVLEVGGVVIGDIPSWRADHMPYGGIKDSGLGREGIRFAIEDMTEIRMLVLKS